MTNEERDKAIRILQWLHDNNFLFRSTEEDVKYAIKLAIHELSQEPCDDAVSRQDVIKAIEEKAKRIKNEDTLNGLAGAVGILYELPPVNPSVAIPHNTGHWIENFEYINPEDDAIGIRHKITGYRCSECGEPKKEYGMNAERTKYCPNCGAKMLEEQERKKE